MPAYVLGCVVVRSGTRGARRIRPPRGRGASPAARARRTRPRVAKYPVRDDRIPDRSRALRRSASLPIQSHRASLRGSGPLPCRTRHGGLRTRGPVRPGAPSRGGPSLRAQRHRCGRTRPSVRKPACTRCVSRARRRRQRSRNRTRARLAHPGVRRPLRFGALPTYGARSRFCREHGRGDLPGQRPEGRPVAAPRSPVNLPLPRCCGKRRVPPLPPGAARASAFAAGA